MQNLEKASIIKFSEINEIRDNNVFLHRITSAGYPIKKVKYNNRICVLKIEGDKSILQERIDSLKPIFGLGKMGVEIVWDADNKKYGCLINWIDSVGDLGTLNIKDWVSSENLRLLVRMAVLDGVVGNQGRFKRNVLLLKDGSIFPIDEGDSGLNPPVWVRMERIIRVMMYKEILKNNNWFQNFIKEVKKTEIEKETDRKYIINKFNDIDKITKETIKQCVF